jgi:hypothetical protein
LDPTDDNLQANKALAELAVGHALEAHRIFETIVEHGYSVGPPYLPARALAAFEQHRATPDLVARDALEKLLIKARKEGLYPVYLGIKTTDIDAAIVAVSAQTGKEG